MQSCSLTWINAIRNRTREFLKAFCHQCSSPESLVIESGNFISNVSKNDPASHSHKVRVAGELMVVNHERNPTPIGRRAEQMPGVRRELREALGREPSRSELAQRLNVSEADIAEI